MQMTLKLKIIYISMQLIMIQPAEGIDTSNYFTVALSYVLDNQFPAAPTKLPAIVAIFP